MKKLKVKNLLSAKQTNFSLKHKARGLKLQILTLLLCVGLFVGCNKTANEVSPEGGNDLSSGNARLEKEQSTHDLISSVKDKIKVIEGRVYFANTDEFISMIGSLSNKSDEEYESLEQKLGFSSLRNYNKKQVKDSSQIKFKDFNFPPHVATLLNSDGEIQIGDTLMLYHGNAQYFILKGKGNFINALRKGQLSDNELKNIVLLKRDIKPFEKKELSSVISNGRVESYPLYIGQNVSVIHISPTYYSGGHQYRIVFEIGHYFQPNYGYSYSEFYTRINIEYYQSSIWGGYYSPVGENTDRVIYSLNAYGNSPALYPNNSFSINNYSSQSLNSTQGFYRTLAATNVYQPCSNNNCEWTINYFLGDYMGRHYNGSGTAIGYYRNTNLQF